MRPSAELTEGCRAVAIAAESLYLVNLLVAPGLGFLLLLGLWHRSRDDAPPLAASHLAQTISGSVWAGHPAGDRQWADPAARWLRRAERLGGRDYLFHHVPLDVHCVRRLWTGQGDGRTVLALSAGWQGLASGLWRGTEPWPEPDCSGAGWPSRRASFLLFVLAPPLDILRIDLTRGHAILLGMDWTLGIDTFLGGEGSAGEAAFNLFWRGFVPLFGGRRAVPVDRLALRPPLLRLAVPAFLRGRDDQQADAARQRQAQHLGTPAPARVATGRHAARCRMHGTGCRPCWRCSASPSCGPWCS